MVPVDERLGIVDGFSPGLKRACAAASIAEPFEGGMELVKEVEKLGSNSGTTSKKVTIVNSGAAE